jgi:hypothetical protein
MAMNQSSPALEGFRAIFRRPVIGLAEIAWRWGFGAATAALLAFTFLEYLDTLPVTAADLFLLRTRQPFLISQAIGHILRGSASRAVHAVVLLAILLSLAWIVVAMLGRAVTTRAVVNYFEGDDSRRVFFEMKSLAGLNLLRVGAALAAVVGLFGATVLGGMISPDTDPSPGTAMLVFFAVLTLVGLAWGLTNWFLSLASLLIVTDGLDTFAAIAATVGLCRERFGAVLAASSWFGLAHGAVYFIASVAAALPLAFAGALPARAVIGVLLLVSLVYFFVADFLYMGRLAAYVYIIKNPESEKELNPPIPTLGPPDALESQSGRVDRDEVILSDVPWSPESA